MSASSCRSAAVIGFQGSFARANQRASSLVSSTEQTPLPIVSIVRVIPFCSHRLGSIPQLVLLVAASYSDRNPGMPLVFFRDRVLFLLAIAKFRSMARYDAFVPEVGSAASVQGEHE
jgi:hypothetical protein